jgi:acetoin utilization protein AcuB
MLVVDLMTRDIVTVGPDTPVLEALKLMRERGFRRLPVVDEDGRPVGVVSEGGIERLKPAGLPVLWNSASRASKHTVAEAMNKHVVTVKPTDTVEFATRKAQQNKVGSLLVVDDNKIVGIVTTNDIFYRIVNPTLGIDEAGTRIVVIGGGSGKNAVDILSAINKMGVEIKIIWSVISPTNQKRNLVVHLDTDDARNVVGELTRMGYETRIVNR